jgi:hypothetical protein
MTDRTETPRAGDDPAARDARDTAVAVVDAPAAGDTGLDAGPGEHTEGDRPAAVSAAPRGPSLLARAGRRIGRRPTGWVRRPWPTERIVQVTVTAVSLIITTYVMMNVVHFR